MFSVDTMSSAVTSLSTDNTNPTTLGALINAYKSDSGSHIHPTVNTTTTTTTNTITTTPSIQSKLAACRVVLIPLPDKLLKSSTDRCSHSVVACGDDVSDVQVVASACLVNGDLSRKNVSDRVEYVGIVSRDGPTIQRSCDESYYLSTQHWVNDDYNTGMEACRQTSNLCWSLQAPTQV